MTLPICTINGQKFQLPFGGVVDTSVNGWLEGLSVLDESDRIVPLYEKNRLRLQDGHEYWTRAAPTVAELLRQPKELARLEKREKREKERRAKKAGTGTEGGSANRTSGWVGFLTEALAKRGDGGTKSVFKIAADEWRTMGKAQKQKYEDEARRQNRAVEAPTDAQESQDLTSPPQSQQSARGKRTISQTESKSPAPTPTLAPVPVLSLTPAATVLSLTPAAAPASAAASVKKPRAPASAKKPRAPPAPKAKGKESDNEEPDKKKRKRQEKEATPSSTPLPVTPPVQTQIFTQEPSSKTPSARQAKLTTKGGAMMMKM